MHEREREREPAAENFDWGDTLRRTQEFDHRERLLDDLERVFPFFSSFFFCSFFSKEDLKKTRNQTLTWIRGHNLFYCTYIAHKKLSEFQLSVMLCVPLVSSRMQVK